MKTLTRKTDQKARLTLPSDFASCLVTVERHGADLLEEVIEKAFALLSPDAEPA